MLFIVTVVLFMCMQGLTIIAFNDGSFKKNTVLELLSLGPTYVVMKFIESQYEKTFSL
jgi:callose synthase